MRLVSSSVLVALILLAGYELVFRMISGRYMVRAESVPIQNMISVQRYLYEETGAKVVIVGSSLSGRLQSTLLPEEVVNLALGGMSSLDGLQIIVDSGARPRLVMIEANVLDRPQRTEFLKRALASPISYLRRYLQSLRDSGRPLTVGLSYVQAISRRMGAIAGISASVPQSGRSADPGPETDSSLFKTLLAYQERSYSVSVSDSERRQMFEVADRLLDKLGRRGVRMAFFEMPVHPSLCELPRSREMRELIKEHYRGQLYARLSSCDEVHTTDGVHLTPAEGARVTMQLDAVIASEIGVVP